MKINSAVFKFQNVTKANQRSVNKSQNSSKVIDHSSLDLLKNYNKAFITFTGVMAMTASPAIAGDLSAIIAKDQPYRNQLAKHTQCSPEALKCIAGVNEFRHVLRNATPEQFNPKSEEFSLNFHNHTKNSDGALEVKDLLDLAVDYADNKAKRTPFYIAITNHNETSGIKEALDVIKQNPEKYANIRVVLGIEFDGNFNKPDLYPQRGPRMDILAHCVDPYENKFVTMVSAIRQQQKDYANSYLDIVCMAGLMLTDDDLEQIVNKSMASGLPDIGRKLQKAVKKFMKTEKNTTGLTEENIEFIFSEFKKKQPMPTVQYIIFNASQIEGVNVGLAHPAKIKVNKGLKKGNSPEEAITQIINDAKVLGAEMIEAYYQYEKAFYKDNPKKYGYEVDDWVAFITEKSNAAGLMRSGGIDIHGKSFFARY